MRWSPALRQLLPQKLKERPAEYRLAVDSVSKFYNSFYVSGWFHHEALTLTGVSLVEEDLRGVISRVGIPHGGVESDLGPNKGFFLQVLRSTDRLPDIDELELVFTMSDGAAICRSLGLLIKERNRNNRSASISSDFYERVNASAGTRLLDVGGRDRSRIDRSKQFPGVETIVLDIIAVDNVDVVGDAHEMSHLFPENHFDFVYSVSVFEHLAMPWKVACEMNRVMKIGAVGLVHSHQMIGMHDAPWDFFRFSDTAWNGLFNKHTGFELLASAMDDPQYAIPFLYRNGKEDAERSAGFESSTVMFRKIGPPGVSWDVSLSDVIETSYPED